ncbi:hypothetical protein KXT57_23510, partial [Salmonella enterica subsp. enterica serovar Weltevreden]|nr:hypothetical protein [Salmonella enterica subsp. enterica serovar Weltevreden]
FDSGSTSYSVVDARPEFAGHAADMYLEGSDQHRQLLQTETPLANKNQILKLIPDTLTIIRKYQNRTFHLIYEYKTVLLKLSITGYNKNNNQSLLITSPSNTHFRKTYENLFSDLFMHYNIFIERLCAFPH